MGNKRAGFTMIELIVGITVMLVTISVASMSINSSGQKPKREAERIAGYLTRLTQKSDRIHVSFDVSLDANVSPPTLTISWGTNKDKEPPFELNAEIAYEPHFNISNINDTKTKNWTYQRNDYPHGVKIDAISTLSTANSDEGYHKSGHRYIMLTANKASPYYVLITSRDEG